MDRPKEDVLPLFESSMFKVLIFCVFIVIICTLLAREEKNPLYHQFPRLENPWWKPNFLGKSPNTLFSEGYEKVIVPHDTPFVVKWWSKDYLILPAKYMSDLRHMRAENASFLKNFSDAVNLQHSVGRLYESDRMGDILRKGMNPILSSLTPLIVEEIQRAVGMELGYEKEWRDFKATETLIMISHRVVSRLLAGEELARSETFIHDSLRFGDSAFVTGLVIAQLPVGPLRPAFAWLLCQYHKLLLRRVMRQTEPVVQRRIDEAKALGKSTPRYDDSIEWAIKLNEPPERDAKIVSLEMLHILEAAAGAPGALMTETIYNILMEPRYLPELLAEIQETREKYGLTNEAVQNMPKLDSFLMETNRLFPVGGVTTGRTIMHQPITLHDGITLPIGTRIGFICKAMQRDSRLFDDAQHFDGMRFANLNAGKDAADGSSAKEDGGRYNASSATTTHLPWGYGAHTCPGRFYSIRLAKLVLMTILPYYDIEWADQGAFDKERPVSFEVEGQFLPNMEQKLRIRRKLEC